MFKEGESYSKPMIVYWWGFSIPKSKQMLLTIFFSIIFSNNIPKLSKKLWSTNFFITCIAYIFLFLPIYDKISEGLILFPFIKTNAFISKLLSSYIEALQE